ncbi:MAG: hypothetical protein V1750_03430 [Acidobacteriota bacterium]
MSLLAELLTELLQREGAIVDRSSPEILDVVSPPHVQRCLHLDEWARLSFGPARAGASQRVTLDSDWLQRLDELLGGRGRHDLQTLLMDCPAPGDPERVAAHTLVLANATYRLTGVAPAWTRYVIITFRYTAVSDDKHEGLLQLGLNLATGSTIDGLREALLEAAASDKVMHLAAPPERAELPPPWDEPRLAGVVARALPGRLDELLAPFLAGMRRRQNRDLARLLTYYSELRQECYARHAAGRTKERPAGGGLDPDLVAGRLEAIAREYHLKVADLRQKYAMNIEVQWLQTLELLMPVQRFSFLIRRRKGERRLVLDWNPWAKRLEPLPCEHTFTAERQRVVCDDALHLVSPPAHGDCPGCGKPYCRACHPAACPRCGGPRPPG